MNEINQQEEGKEYFIQLLEFVDRYLVKSTFDDIGTTSTKQTITTRNRSTFTQTRGE